MGRPLPHQAKGAKTKTTALEMTYYMLNMLFSKTQILTVTGDDQNVQTDND